jgi:hypothetical protein
LEATSGVGGHILLALLAALLGSAFSWDWDQLRSAVWSSGVQKSPEKYSGCEYCCDCDCDSDWNWD